MPDRLVAGGDGEPGDAVTPSRYITPERVLAIRFGERARPAWDLAVLCFRDARGSAALVKALDAVPVGATTLYGLHESADRPYVFAARVGAARVVIVTRCLWGGPQTAILVEELCALGVRVVIGFGAAGSLVPDLAKGAQLVAPAGIATDGTSRAYTADGEVVAGDSGLRDALAGVARGLEIPLASATVATVDALYRETHGDVARWVAAGASAINMETTPLYAAARACGVRGLWLGHVSDSLVRREWESWVRPDAVTDVTVLLATGLLRAVAGTR